MIEQVYIHISNWEQHQRFKERRPVWVKLHTSLMRDDEYLGLSGHRRAILHALWMEYALNMRKDADAHYTVARGIALDPQSKRTRTALGTHSLSLRLALRVTVEDIEALNHAGFLFLSAHRLRSDASQNESLEVQSVRSKRGSKEEPPLAKQGATVENSGDGPGEVTEAGETPDDLNAGLSVPAPLSVTSLDDFKARAARVQARVEQARRSG